MKRFLHLAAVIIALCSAFPASAQWTSSTGYHSTYELGFNIGTGGRTVSSFEFTTTQGYQVIPVYLYLGAGAGIQAYFSADGAVGFPTFFNIRSHFSKSSASPFIDLRVGYTTMANDDYFLNGGFYFNPSLGLRVALGSSIGLTLRCGYTLQYAKEAGWVPYAPPSRNIGGINVMAGIEF